MGFLVNGDVMRVADKKIHNLTRKITLPLIVICIYGCAYAQENDGRQNIIKTMFKEKDHDNPVILFKIFTDVFDKINCQPPFEMDIIFNELSEKSNDDDAEINWALGMAYYYGHGVNKNKKVGIEFLEKAAQKNNIDSLIKLGKLYSTTSAGKNANAVGVAYYKKAYDLLLPKATSGDIHAMEKIYFEDFKEHLPFEKIDDELLWRKLLELKSPRALTSEGRSMIWPSRPISDIKMGISLLNDSAKQNEPFAIAALINIYENGIKNGKNFIVKKDEKSADYWTKRAIDLFGCDLAELRNSSE